MKKEVIAEVVHCRECVNVVPMTDKYLSVDGTPTLGRCPYWTKTRSVLLSQKGCEKFRRHS